MWEKLLQLFEEKYYDDPNYIAPSIAKREARQEQLASQIPQLPERANKEAGKGTLIGFDYLKGLKDDEDDVNNNRRFINLNRVLRGNYKDGKIEKTFTESESDIRGEDSE